MIRDMFRRLGGASLATLLVLAVFAPRFVAAQHLLIPMDDAQRQHLKAYGLTFNAIKEGMRAEWLLNYRGGAFLLPDAQDVRRKATIDGVIFEALDASA